MLNTTQASTTGVRVSVTLAPGCSTTSVSMDISASPPLPTIAASSVFPVSTIAQDNHPRTSAWAGLAEASQILAEAEAHKGSPLSREELRALMEAHLDAYDADWAFGRSGISEAWMAGWSHAFALAAQQVERLRDPEPLHGIGLVSRQHLPLSAQPDQPRTTICFRKAQIAVADLHAFWQGVWEGQLAALDEQEEWIVIASEGSGESLFPLSSARIFDDLLDLVYETGNHGLDFVTGYVLGYSEGLLCGRTVPPVRREATPAD